MSDIKAYAVVYGLRNYQGEVFEHFKVYQTLGAARRVAGSMSKQTLYNPRSSEREPYHAFVRIIEMTGGVEVPLKKEEKE